MTIPKFRTAVLVFLIGFALGLSVFAASRLFVISVLDADAIAVAEDAAAKLARGEPIKAGGSLSEIVGYAYLDANGAVIDSAANGDATPVLGGADASRLADLTRSRGAVLDEAPLLPTLFLLSEATTKRVAVPVAADGKTFGTLVVEVDQKRSLESLTRAFAVVAMVAVGLAVLAIIVVAFVVTRGSGFSRSHKTFNPRLVPRDPLTELPTRNGLTAVLDDAIARAAESDQEVGLMIVGIDGFRAVNAIWGHGTGDEVLQQTAERLRPFGSGPMGVARVGGDEFAVTLDGNATLAMHQTADAIRAVMAEPFVVGDSSIVLGASIGAALFPVNADSGQFLFRAADSALSKAKADGRNALAVFDTEMKQRMERNATLERDMRLALSRDEFVIFYQPQIDLSSGALRGYEALVRWERPGEGIVSQRDFLTLAEDTGLVREIGEWMLRKACEDAASWLDEGTVAVNLSAAHFHAGDVDRKIAAALEQTRLSPDRLEIEVPESIVLGNPGEALDALKRIKALGVRVSVDEFGHGYADLASLARFPFDKIKIDRRFVNQLSEDEGAAAIVAAIVTLARTLGADVTAEGVESGEQITLLKAAGCNVGQGFLFGAPKRAAGDEGISAAPVLAAAAAVLKRAAAEMAPVTTETVTGAAEAGAMAPAVATEIHAPADSEADAGTESGGMEHAMTAMGTAMGTAPAAYPDADADDEDALESAIAAEHERKRAVSG